jgi:hypothetical protein
MVAQGFAWFMWVVFPQNKSEMLRKGKALNSLRPLVTGYIMQLIQRIQSLSQPINVTENINFFTVDVMGELTFSQPFDMLHTGEAKKLFISTIKIVSGAIFLIEMEPDSLELTLIVAN